MRLSQLGCFALALCCTSACYSTRSTADELAAKGSSAGATLMADVAQVCAALVHAECEQRAACGAVPASCLKGVEACSEFYGEMTRRKVEQGYLVWDRRQLAACVASPGTHACSTGRFAWSAACRELLRPNSNIGEACFPEEPHLNPSTCSAGWCPEAHGETGPCPATCQLFRVQGEACSDAQRCELGLHCSGGLCVAPARLGQVCGETPCGSGLWCAQESERSVCAPRSGAGSACDYDPSCESGLCLDGICAANSALGKRCRETTQCGVGNVCTAVPLDASGTLQLQCLARQPLGSHCERDETCQLGAICESNRCVSGAPAALGRACVRTGCEPGSFCGGASQTCLATSARGGPCSNDRRSELFGACAPGDYCGAANTCRPVAAPGAACSESAGCPGAYYCGPQGTCAPRKAWGRACAAGPECYSSVCSPTTHTCVGYCTP